MDGDVSRVPPHALGSIEGSRGACLIYRVAGVGRDHISVAKWRLENASVTTGDLMHGILVMRTAGGAAMTRRTRGESVRKRPAIGELTYAPADDFVRWTSEGTSEALHVYLPTARLRRFAEEELDASTPPRIDDFFAEVDPWLQGYFKMLSSEIEIFNYDVVDADPLFLAQTEYVLLRHLLRWHSAASAPSGATERRKVNALPPNLMRRVQGYVEAHLADDIRLQDLAELACMSTGHFLRGFRVASGTTPYRYVLEQRLQSARSMLRSSLQPVSRIAVECGFKTLAHLSARFHGRFGMSPSKFRAAQRRD